MKISRICCILAVVTLFISFCIGPSFSAIPSNQPVTFDPKITLSSLMSLTDNYIKAMADSFHLLALTAEVKSGQWQKIKPLLSQLKKQNVPAVICYVRTDGTYYTVDKGLVKYNVKKRAYFKKALAGQTVIGEMIVSYSTGRNVTVVAVPVKNNRGKVIGILLSSIYLDELTELVKKEMNLPPNVLFYAVNPETTIVITWKKYLILKKPEAVGSSSLTKALKEMVFKREGVISYEFEGKVRTVIYKTSPFTKWTFALGTVEK